MSNYMIGKPKLSAGRGQMGERTKKKKVERKTAVVILNRCSDII